MHSLKEFYNKSIDQVPIYLFKSTEFELRHVNDLFQGCDLNGFIEFHRRESKKVIIIDSAEKLLDIRNTDPFKELLSRLIENGWTIIFTTRNSYLEDLNYQFFETYRIQPLYLPLSCLSVKELNEMSQQYSFNLPADERLMELVRVPFYLNEYLKYYKDESLDHLSFKNTLWNREIVKAKPAREQCFLKIAFERANNGCFFISPECEISILDNELRGDGILGYETAGYFITHDIYEEWALERIIESSYVKMIDDSDFFARIGQSLPIRRSFRSWLSYKLSTNEESIFDFIERAVQDNAIESFWKDEILISVLLSGYAEVFFDKAASQLLDNDCELLKKMTFLLRLACKEVDSSLLKGLGINNPEFVSMGFMFTRPKGEGWSSLIEFVLDNLGAIGSDKIQFVLPVIRDWTKSTKTGQTTRNAGLIALSYYEWCIKDGGYFRQDDTGKELFETIVDSASEISIELEKIFDDIVKNKWIDHRAPYYDLTEFILTKLEGINVSKVLPKQVLKLLDLYWYKKPKDSISTSYRDISSGSESKFCLSDNVHFKYFPASAFQTPIYWLLQSSFKETVDFIIAFTNKTVEFYTQSGFDNVKEVSVFISDDEIVKQQHSPALWGMYRGTSSPVTPYLVQSVHMALEKFLLEVFEKAESKVIQNWLIYLLRNSRSSSISSVVVSVVLAYPEKTFDVAAILFNTKEFIQADLSRKLQEDSAKMLYSMGSGLGIKNEVLNNERIKTCDDKHRGMALEHFFLNYQFFRSEEISEQEADRRQCILWSILDAYYNELPDESDQSEQDKAWRMFLARMDRRKMNPTTEVKDDKIVVNFNPELEPNLKEYSETAMQGVEERSKYLALQLWANQKWEKDERYRTYEKYENDPLKALREVEEIIAQLSSEDADGTFQLFNVSLPTLVCSVLLRDNINELDEEKRDFCKTVVLEAASLCFQEGYHYQIGDGIKQAFSVFPIILKEFPDERETIKSAILIALLTGRDEFAIDSIHNGLWSSSWDDANSLLLGYLWMKPIYDSLRGDIQEENYKKGEYGVHEFEVIKAFLASNENDVLKVIENKLPASLTIDFDVLRRRTLTTALQALPVEINDPSHKELVQNLVAAFVSRQLSKEASNHSGYQHKHEFLERYVWTVLKSKEEDVQYFIQPFIDAFSHSELFSDLIYEFVIAEDRAEACDNFWTAWGLFRSKVLEVASTQSWRADKMIKCFLFAQVTWKDTTKDWHSLKETNKPFIEKIVSPLGHHPATLYSISKLLNDIGSPFLDSGVGWVSRMIASNEGLASSELEINTIYYLESICRKYVYKKREQIKRSMKMKSELLVILNFLVAVVAK